MKLSERFIVVLDTSDASGTFVKDLRTGRLNDPSHKTRDIVQWIVSDGWPATVLRHNNYIIDIVSLCGPEQQIEIRIDVPHANLESLIAAYEHMKYLQDIIECKALSANNKLLLVEDGF